MRPFALTNLRLVDPASGHDGPGAVIVTEGVVADVAQGGELGALGNGIQQNSKQHDASQRAAPKELGRSPAQRRPPGQGHGLPARRRARPQEG